MSEISKRITLPCDCKCCMLVIEKTLWDDGDTCYNISIQDSRYDHGFNTVWGRLKRAAKALFGKPVYFNDLYLDGEDTFRQFVSDMDELTRFTAESEGRSLLLTWRKKEWKEAGNVQ